MLSLSDLTPMSEVTARHTACRNHLATLQPDATGLLTVNRLSIYYFTGTLANGIFWLPREGDPILFVRRNIDRARLESPVERIVPFRSYGELPSVILEGGVSQGVRIACEKNVFPWSLAEALMHKFPGTEFVAGDMAIARTRACKSPWEMEKMRHAGAMHAKAICDELPQRIHPGMSERDIAVAAWEVFFALGHAGLLRMSAFGEENFLGAVSVGESGNYPVSYNGPSGSIGGHPAVPLMGSPAVIWRENMLLSLDLGFCHHGYVTDKTQGFFSGAAKDVPDIAKRANDLCVVVEKEAAAALRPGAIPSQLYQKAVRMVDAAGFGETFMGFGKNQLPFLGHSIGLTYDEWPVLADRFDEPLQAGMVISIEPKIGLAGLGLVGTENTYEVTEEGGKSLTGPPGDLLCLA